ncbi:C80 family cysteine peptidase [Mitsuaria sp. 7]|uniref:C80 family cysteine peptidase n=1 Tax=Mitsuaria sp. 7 TaxID=1658665 RepID=UPI0007DDD3CA|nr:C80 family cysteine peptidase [Mitsuaria sp. 7]ANH70989.1 hypothetical protein ABE85_26050 [Mitsuaria sp. 7]
MTVESTLSPDIPTTTTTTTESTLSPDISTTKVSTPPYRFLPQFLSTMWDASMDESAKMLQPHAGLVRVLLKKYGDALKDQRGAWKPVVADLQRLIREEFGKVDALRDGAMPSEALDRAARSMTDALQHGDMEALGRAYFELDEHFFDTNRSFVVTVNPSPHGVIDAESPLFASSAMYRQSMLASHEAAFLAGLHQGVRTIADEHADLQGASAVLIGQSLDAAITESKFILEAEQIERLRQSGVPSDQHFLDAIRRLYPAIGEAAQHGLVQPVEVIWTTRGDGVEDVMAELFDQYRATSSDREIRTVLGMDTVKGTPASGAAIDEQRPLTFLEGSLPAAEQRLDRAAGSIEVRWPATDTEPSRTITLKFRPLPPDATEDVRHLQDLDIRLLDEHVQSHFVRWPRPASRGFPHEIILSDGRIMATRLLLARHEEETGWRTSKGGVLRAMNVLNAFSAPKTLNAGQWSDHGYVFVEAPRPAQPLQALRIQLQMEDDWASVVNIASALHRHPDNTVWIRAGSDGSWHVVRGKELLSHLAPDVNIAIEIVGHGTPVQNARRMQLSGYSPVPLSQRVSALMADLGLPAKVTKVTLYSCALETLMAAERYSRTFLNSAIDMDWMIPPGKVTGYAEVVGSHPRMTQKYGGAEWRYHAPKRTFVHTGDDDGGEMARRDKYPRLEADPTLVESYFTDLGQRRDDEASSDPLADIDAVRPEGELGAPVLDLDPYPDAVELSRRAVVEDIRYQAGQAGTLMAAFEGLEHGLRTSKIKALAGDPPASVVAAIRRELLLVYPKGDERVDVTRASRATKAIAEGLWHLKPARLYEGFVEMSRMFDPDALVPFHWSDLPKGLKGKAVLPSRMLAKYRKTVVMPAAEVALMKSLDAGFRTIMKLDGKSASANDPLRAVVGQQTSEFVESILSGRPFVVDVDKLRLLAPAGRKRPAQSLPVDILEVVHGTAMRLARQGIIPSPIYLTDAKVDPAKGWETSPKESSVHRGDLLPELLPQRKGAIMRARAPSPQSFDETRPLASLTRFMPNATQVLDRERGTVTITWPGKPGERQADSVLHFSPAGAGADASAERRAAQTADIQALDEFIVPAFFDLADSRQNSMPAELTLSEGTLSTGRATLGRRVDGRWILDHDVLEHVRFVFGIHDRGGTPTPVSKWEYSLSDKFPGTAGEGRKLGAKLRLHLQVEDDRAMLRGARRAVRNHPNEVVWIQVDRLGNHEIRYGEGLLKQVTPDTPVKISIEGHGRTDDTTRTQRLGDSTPSELLERVAPVIERLGLQSRAVEGVLLGCQLVALFATGDYAEDFLSEAMKRGLFRQEASLEAFAENVVFNDAERRAKWTRRFRGDPRRDHESGATWVYRMDHEKQAIVRHDKYPAGDAHSSGLDSVRVLGDEKPFHVRPGRAGTLSELFGTLTATQGRSGIVTIQTGPAPDAMVTAVRGRLASLYDVLHGGPGMDLGPHARLIADGIWQSRPEKLNEAFAQLTDLAGDRGWMSRATWSGDPMGVVDRVRTPLQMRLKFDTVTTVPLPDAALLDGMKSAVQAMEGLPVDMQPDAVGRAFARQTLSLTEATLSGRPFTIDADAVFRMSGSKAAGDRATLDVLDVMHGTAMQMAGRDLMQAPIYLTDGPQTAVGWTTPQDADGSYFHRGDILADILPERRATLELLRTRPVVEITETNPLPSLTRLMPRAQQTLDRALGTVRIVWPDDMKNGRQAASVLHVEPSDAAPGTQGRHKQDTAIAALDDFIIGEFLSSAGLMRNSVPAELTFHNDELRAGNSLLAKRDKGRWVRNDDALQEAVEILNPQTPRSKILKPAQEWDADLGGALSGVVATGKGRRLLVHLQMEDDIAMLNFARRTIRTHPDETVWIQVDREGGHVIRYGEHLLKQAGAELPVKIEISGHGSHDPATRTQRLSGYGHADLVERASAVIGDLGLMSRARQLTLVSCAIEAPPVADSFGRGFMETAIAKGLVHEDASMVAYGEVLVRRTGLLADAEPSRTTRMHSDAAPTKHKSGVTWMFKRDRETRQIVRTDKYPDTGTATAPVDAAGDEDSAWDGLSEHREVWEARTRETVAEGLAGRTLSMDGFDVPMSFLASLGAQIDGQPLTMELLRSLADLPGDPFERLKIDADLFADWVTLLRDRTDGEVADRLRALDGWITEREAQAGPGTAFVGEPSAKSRKILDRMKVAVANDMEEDETTEAGWTESTGAEDASRGISGPMSPEARAQLELEMAAMGKRATAVSNSSRDTAPDSRSITEVGPTNDPVAEIDGETARDARLIKAVQGDDVVITSILGEVLVPVPDGQPTSAVDVKEWLAKRGMTFDDVADMQKPKAPRVGDTSVEMIAREIGHRARDQSDVDFKRLVAMNQDTALASLREIGVMSADQHGLRLDAGRLQAFIDSRDGLTLAKAGRAFNKMSDNAYRTLLESAPQGVVRHFMDQQRNLPKIDATKFEKVFHKLSVTVDFVYTVQGMLQILTSWDEMSPAMRGLSVTQTLSVVISPLATMLGQALGTLGTVARFGVLRAATTGLSMGAANVAFSLVGAAMCGLQWKDFLASGQSFDSYAGKSLIINTVMTSIAVAIAITSFVIGTVAAVSAVVSVALATASMVMSKVAGPIAIIMFVANAVAQAALWFDTFGQYIRESTSVGDRVLAAFAKAFGFSTDVTLRAEVEKAAREAAASLSNALKGQFNDSMAFEAGQLAKLGYDTFMVPETTHPVKETTFYDAQTTQKYTFFLQPGTATAETFRKDTRQRLRQELPSGTAWLSMEKVREKHFFADDGSRRQLFQVGNRAHVFVHGGGKADVFQMKKTDGAYIDGTGVYDGQSGEGDEVQIDAEGADLRISPRWPGARVLKVLSYADAEDTSLVWISHFVVRNAGKAEITGDSGDERFDISAKEADIKGGGGRNTYAVRKGNRIVSTSNDVAIWTRGVSDASVDVGESAKASLLLKVDVPHESLSLRRDGADLLVFNGNERLTLKRYFDRLGSSSSGTLPPVSFVDGLGTVITLINPGVIDDKVVAMTDLAKHLVINSDLPASRRTLSGDNAYNRIHLSSGAGDIRVLPMTGMPMDLSLDISAERLRMLSEGDDLLIIETPPADADANFAPLRLRLSGQRRAAVHVGGEILTVWVKEREAGESFVTLLLPGSDQPVDGPVRLNAALTENKVDVSDKTTDASSAKTNVAASIPGQGTDKDDVIEAWELPEGTVLRGGGGADTYRMRAGQSVIIDNSATDSAMDVLALEFEGLPGLSPLGNHQSSTASDIDRGDRLRALLDGIRFSRAGDDLQIELGGGRITVLKHATTSQARRLSLEIAGDRFALPVIQKGVMVHEPSGTAGTVLATAPGSHLVLPSDGAPWNLKQAPRIVRMNQPGVWSRHGSMAETSVEGERASTVTLLDYHLYPQGWQLWVSQPSTQCDVMQTVESANAQPEKLLRLGRAIRSGEDYSPPPEDVIPYLAALGMPERIATQLHLTTTDQLRRLHALLTVTGDGGKWQLPTAFVAAYLATGLTPLPHQGSLLTHLASGSMPWRFAERVLRGTLTMAQLGAFESWAAVSLPGEWGDEALAALKDFILMLGGEAPSAKIPSLLATVLELKGRPSTVSQELAMAMLAAGTMDDQWTAGMLQAGVVHHGVLSLLSKEKVSPQDVVLSNANRLRYESGDRSALIAVDTSPEFKSKPTKAYRYTLTRYLKLDNDGEIDKAHKAPVPGIEYDAVPGVIVDQSGASPEPQSTYDAWKKMHDEKKAAEHKKQQEYSERSKMGASQGSSNQVNLIEPALDRRTFYIPPLSSVVRLWDWGYAKAEPYDVDGSWWMRSTPGNLVDGLEGRDDIVAWEPYEHLWLKDRYIQFDFAHPIALESLSLSSRTSLGSPVEFNSEWPAEWVVQAQSQDGQWISVSPIWKMANGYTKAQRLTGIDTKGVPYRSYRLTGVGGVYPKWVWFSEVTFTTAEAGAAPKAITDALRNGGFSDEEARGLYLHGLRDEEQARRAIDLRLPFDDLPPAVIMKDVEAHRPMGEAARKILDNLFDSSMDARQWPSERLLKAVRLRMAVRHIDLLNQRLPFLDPAPVKEEDAEHSKFVAEIKTLLSKLRDHVAKGGDQDKAGLPVIDPLVYKRAQELLEKHHGELRKRLGEDKAALATVPWSLHLTMLMDAAHDRPLILSLGAGTSPTERATVAVIENSLVRLQSATEEGLIGVSFLSLWRPVGGSTRWRTKGGGYGDERIYSPGADLAAEFRAARAGQPIQRLRAGGFTQIEAESMFNKGVVKLSQVTQAIEWRRLFTRLSSDAIAKDVLLDRPFDDGQHKLVNYMSTRHAWKEHPEKSVERFRKGLTKEQRVGVIDGLLPNSPEGLVDGNLTMPMDDQVKAWLHAAQGKNSGIRPLDVNISIAMRLLLAARGISSGLQGALELAVFKDLRRFGKEEVTETSPWTPRMLGGLVSLAGASSGAGFKAAHYIVLSTYEQLLDELDKKLRAAGYSEEKVLAELRPKYFDLAVIRAALSGQQLRLHVPSGESPQEKELMTLIEARLKALEDAELIGFVDATIASSMPPSNEAVPWTTEVVGGKTWYLSPQGPLETAWNEAKAGQPMPLLKSAGYSEKRAQVLFAQGVCTPERVARAIELREHFGDLPTDVIVKDVETPLDNIDDAWYWRLVKEHASPDPAAFLAAVRGNLVRPLPEVVLDPGYLPLSRDSLLNVDEEKYKEVRDAVIDRLSQMMGVEPDAQGRTGQLVQSLREHRELNPAMLRSQWWHIQRGLQDAVDDTSPWDPERLRGIVSIGRGEGAGREILRSTAVVLQAYEQYVDLLAAELQKQGCSEAEVTEAVVPLFLQLAMLRAVASGEPLRLHVPVKGSPLESTIRRVVERELPLLEVARRDGAMDIAIASSLSPGVERHKWTSHEVEGKSLYVSSNGSLEVAWRDGILNDPFNRLAAGSGDDEARSLHDGGIQTIDQVDRAIQLRNLFGELPSEVVLQDVLGSPPLTPLQAVLGARLGKLLHAYQMDALGLVRGGLGDIAPLILISDALRVQGMLSFVFDERLRSARAAKFLDWLSSTQGPGWSSDNAAVLALADAMVSAAGGHWQSLSRALAISRGLNLLHLGQARVADAENWMPEFVSRHAKLVAAGDVGVARDMAASDYIVLQGYKRLLDGLYDEFLRDGVPEESISCLYDSYFHLQVLRAVATGQRVELHPPQGDNRRDRSFRQTFIDLRRSLEKLQSSGLLRLDLLTEVSQLVGEEKPASDAPAPLAQGGTAHAEESALDDAGSGSIRQASLLKQAMSSLQDEGSGGPSAFGVSETQSKQVTLAGQAT